jgi:hypothetical protein
VDRKQPPMVALSIWDFGDIVSSVAGTPSFFP